MAPNLGCVIVGTGFGVLTHLRAARKAGIEVKALVGRDPERTRARADRVGVEQALTSLDEALALPGVDLVTIATPPHTHEAIAVAAAPHPPLERRRLCLLPLGTRGIGTTSATTQQLRQRLNNCTINMGLQLASASMGR